MRWINMNEKDMIVAWAKEESTDGRTQKYLPMPERCDSYWLKHEGDEILEYDFDKIPELKNLLESVLSDEMYKDLIMPLAVAAFKERQIVIEEKDLYDTNKNSVENHSDEGTEMPEYVYVF